MSKNPDLPAMLDDMIKQMPAPLLALFREHCGKGQGHQLLAKVACEAGDCQRISAFSSFEKAVGWIKRSMGGHYTSFALTRVVLDDPDAIERLSKEETAVVDALGGAVATSDDADTAAMLRKANRLS